MDTENNEIALFEQKEIRKIWHNNKWYFFTKTIDNMATNIYNKLIY